MKTLITISIAAFIFSACNNENKKTGDSNVKNSDTTNTQVATNNEQNKNTETFNDLVSGYLNLKNALANDNGKDAATAGNEMVASLEKVDTSAFTSEQKKMYNDVKEDVKEHAEHIGMNGANIAHQREHFEMLSGDMIDLVKTSGSSKTLYKDYCPMYNNNKGASWLSETQEIKNPYLGKKMATCGEVKEEIKAKG
jgi:hypothetical protein